jgi:cbb3-type cytochrome oxidase maturation protein
MCLIVYFCTIIAKKNFNAVMSAIILLIFIGIVVAGGFLAAFIWAVRSGQYDDDYSPSVRMLFDNQIIEEPAKEAENNQPEKTDDTENKSNQNN